MATSTAGMGHSCKRRVMGGWPTDYHGAWWLQHREASLNWLALGLLLAAWNASDSDSETQVQRRPEALRGYSSVSVRAAALCSPERC
ncbi:MAG: hypothetical protein ABJC66_02020 [Gammaproteobacteria bacterium]